MTASAQSTAQATFIEMDLLSSQPSAAQNRMLSPNRSIDRDQTMEIAVLHVESDEDTREARTALLEDGGYTVHSFASAAHLLRNFDPGRADCLLVGSQRHGMSAIETISRVNFIAPGLPAILITGTTTIEACIHAMRVGAVDIVQKPFRSARLYEAIETALSNAKRRRPHAPGSASRNLPDFHFTKRQHEILELVLDGQPSKIIAADLGISQRTVENHRAAIMKKTGSRSIPGLVRVTQSWVAAERSQ
jgi:two-component system CheB/CheR fusion protein